MYGIIIAQEIKFVKIFRKFYKRNNVNKRETKDAGQDGLLYKIICCAKDRRTEGLYKPCRSCIMKTGSVLAEQSLCFSASDCCSSVD